MGRGKDRMGYHLGVIPGRKYFPERRAICTAPHILSKLVRSVPGLPRYYSLSLPFV